MKQTTARSTKTRCGARTRSAGTPCKKRAGQGTDHLGAGKCSSHGGASPGGKPGNKNAVTTGEYETIHASGLSEGERLLYEGVPASPTAQAENTLRLCCIREHRVLLRINAAVAAELASSNGLLVTAVSHLEGLQAQGSVNTQQVDRAPALATIMRLEDSLTRVQTLKLRAVVVLRECLKDSTEEGNPLDALVEAINGSGRRIAEEEDDELLRAPTP